MRGQSNPHPAAGQARLTPIAARIDELWRNSISLAFDACIELARDNPAVARECFRFNLRAELVRAVDDIVHDLLVAVFDRPPGKASRDD
jgi:hypothetical protein